MESESKDQQSELSLVLKEIMSLHRERRELLGSLTPGLSVWKQRRGLGEEGAIIVSRFAGKDYAAAPVQVLVQEMETESASTEEQFGRYYSEKIQFGRYFDSILQDMEDLGHRALSMAHVIVTLDGRPAFSSYMADELVNSASRLMDACKELYTDTNDADADNEQNYKVQNSFLDIYPTIIRKPFEYENELALVATKEEAEDYEKEKERKDEVRKEHMAMWNRWEEKQKCKGKEKVKQTEKEKAKVDPDPATMEYLKKGMETAEQFFADNRDGWNTAWGSKSVLCGDFGDKTTLSPMHFTHYTIDAIRSSCGVTGSTLQIYSITILELKKGLKWPLKLYGVVAARDTVDRNRNIIYSRSSLNHQEISEYGSLCLTGPSRAIVALSSVDFEVELKIKEREESQGKELITLSKRYDGTVTSLIFENSLCKAVLKLEQLSRAVQATIVGVSVVKGDWPFEYGCRVACSLVAAEEVVLLDCRDGGKDMEAHVGSNNYLHLSRNVVSVQLEGTLTVLIGPYMKNGYVARYWSIDFPAKKCQTSESVCEVGTSEVKVVVAWSLLVKEKRDLLVDYPAIEA